MGVVERKLLVSQLVQRDLFYFVSLVFMGSTPFFFSLSILLFPPQFLLHWVFIFKFFKF